MNTSQLTHPTPPSRLTTPPPPSSLHKQTQKHGNHTITTQTRKMINNPPAPRDFREEPDLAEAVDRVVGPVQPNVRQPYASEQGASYEG
jgi:hypothetical protein